MNSFFWCYMCKTFNVCNLLEEEKLWVFKTDLQTLEQRETEHLHVYLNI